MQRRVHAVFRTLLSVLAASFWSLSPAQMSMPGNFSVSPNGGAMYSIPIQIPPGIGGIEPTLTLSYDSQSSNGPLGVGWNVGGLSSITRCPQTIPQDNARTGINYSASDRFCLDGQRLMVINGGVYGAASTEYRTEIESFSKVVANGMAAGGGPSYFVVKTKAGLTMEYGNTTDSSIEVAGKTPLVVRVWALNKIRDTKGNTLKVTYIKDSVNSVFNGGYYPSRIDYTSNENTGLGASNSVVFDYDSIRSDANIGYQAGYAVTNRVRLTKITTQTGAANVLIYTLNYQSGPTSARSRISSITLCTASGNCMPATSMPFQPDPIAGIQWAKQTSPATTDICLAGCGTWRALDLNGDGRLDLVHLKNSAGHYSIWLSKGDGTFTVSEQTASEDVTTGVWQILDANSDGVQDLVHLKDTAGNYSVWTALGNGTFSISTQAPNSSDTSLTTGSWQVLDVNGDGFPDMIHIPEATSSGVVKVWKSTGGSTFSVSQITNPASDCYLGGQCGPWQVLDLNGDGLADLVHISNMTGSQSGTAGYNGVVTWISKGDGTFTVSSSPYPANAAGGYTVSWQAMDVNGDGLIDLVHLTANAGDVRIWLSKGDGTFVVSKFVTTADTTFSSGSWQVVDYNGDGLADLLHLTANSDDFRVWISKGDGTFGISGVMSTGGVDTCLTCGLWQAIDTVGDGVTNLVHFLNDSGQYAVWAMPRNSRDIPASISGGLGNVVSWSTMGLPQIAGQSSPGYSKSLLSGTSVWTFVPPMPVVTSVLASDGVGGFRQTNYSYDSARLERNGRGFLGFNWMQSTDVGTGLTTRSYNALNFPYLGMTTQSTQGKSTSAPDNLGTTTMTYACIDPASTATPPVACAIGPGKRYLVIADTTTARQWDWNGAPLPGTRTQNQNIDVYGNVGKIITTALDGNGNDTGFGKTLLNTYTNDVPNWYLGRLLTSTVTATGPDVPAPVTPGAGGLAAAPAPKLPPQLVPLILSLLLDD